MVPSPTLPGKYDKTTPILDFGKISLCSFPEVCKDLLLYLVFHWLFLTILHLMWLRRLQCMCSNIEWVMKDRQPWKIISNYRDYLIGLWQSLSDIWQYDRTGNGTRERSISRSFVYAWNRSAYFDTSPENAAPPLFLTNTTWQETHGAYTHGRLSKEVLRTKTQNCCASCYSCCSQNAAQKKFLKHKVGINSHTLIHTAQQSI